MNDAYFHFRIDGELFTVLRTEIEKYPNTMLCALIRNKSSLYINNNDEIILSHDRDIFRAVINFYRYGLLKKPINVDEQIFKAAADMFLLTINESNIMKCTRCDKFVDLDKNPDRKCGECVFHGNVEQICLDKLDDEQDRHNCGRDSWYLCKLKDYCHNCHHFVKQTTGCVVGCHIFD